MAEVKVRIGVKAGRVRIHPNAYEELLPDDSSGVLRDMIRRGQQVLEAYFREAPRSSGFLASTFRVQVRTPGSPYGVWVIAGVEDGRTQYLGYILEGTPPHVIRPRTAKALRFVAAGAVRFARKVDHPGTAPNNFILRSLPAANR